MKTLYIPEIGDELTLAKPWTFTLHSERRNETLAAHFGRELLHFPFPGSNWFSPFNGYSMIPLKYGQEFRSIKCEEAIFIKKDGVSTMDPGPFDRYQAKVAVLREKMLSELKLESMNDPFFHEIQVTLPAGTKLKIDRIYIRKGNTEFSSISFLAPELPKVTCYAYNNWEKDKLQRIRFWVKLTECNNIQFK